MITHRDLDTVESVADPNVLANEGYLQEANRRFFHPLGLHLLTALFQDDSEWKLYLLDGREESPEGIVFAPSRGPGYADRRARRCRLIEEEWKRRAILRRKATGFIRQPEEELRRLMGGDHG